MKPCYVEFPLYAAVSVALWLMPAGDRWWVYRVGSVLPLGFAIGRAHLLIEELNQAEIAEQKRLQEEAEQAALAAQVQEQKNTIDQYLAQQKARLEAELAEKQKAGELALRQVARQLDELEEQLKLKQAELERQPTPEEVQAQTLARLMNQHQLALKLGQFEVKANQELEREQIRAELENYKFRLDEAARLGLPLETVPAPTKSAAPITLNQPNSALTHSSQPAGQAAPTEFYDDPPFDLAAYNNPPTTEVEFEIR